MSETAPPPRRRWRWLRRLAFALLLLLLLPVLAVGAALLWANTEGGRGTLARLAGGVVPGLTIEGLRGPLPGRVGAARIALADRDGVWLEANDATLDLDLRALLDRTARVRALTAARIAVARAPVGDPAAPPAPAAPRTSVLPELPRLPVAVELDRLAVDRIELGAPLLGTTATLAVEGAARLRDGALDARLAVRRLDAPGEASLRASLLPGERLDAALTVAEPAGGLVPTLAGQPSAPFAANLTLAGPAGGAALGLQASLGPDITLRLGGTVRAGADGSAGAVLEGEARAAPLLPPDLAPLATPLGLAVDAALGADRRVALRALRLTAPGAQVGATGTIDLGTGALDLALTLRAAPRTAFGALLPPQLGWSGIDASARVGGTIAAPSARATITPRDLTLGVAEAERALGPAPDFTVDAALPGPRLRAAVVGAQARLDVDGTLAEPVALTARLALPRLDALSPLGHGALLLEARATGRLADPAVTLRATADRLAAAGRVLEGLDLQAEIADPASAPRVNARLAARLDGLPLSLDLRGAPEDGGVRLSAAEARFGPARLTAAGRLDPTGPLFDGTARLSADDLAPLGRLAGVAGLVGRLTLDAELRPRDGQQGFALRLDAPRVGVGAQTGTVNATVTGTPAALDWTLRARGEPGAVEGRGALARDGGGWRLDLAALTATAQGETLRLAAPARVVLGADGGVALPGLALTLGGGRLTAAGRWGPERADLTATLAALPLAPFGRFAPDVLPAGTLGADVRVTGPTARPEIRATLRGDGLRSGAAWGRGLPTLTLRATASLLGQAAEARAEVEAGTAGRVTATARLPGGFGPAAPLAATLEGGLSLAPLADPFLAAGGQQLSGRLALALRAEGTVGAPRYGGRVELTGGDLRDAASGARLADIGALVTGEGTRLVLARLSARPGGGGTLSASGSVDAGAAGLPADLTLTARGARPIVSDLGSATFDADLRATGPLLGDGRVAGEVRITAAELRVPESLPGSVPVLAGVRVRGRAPPGAVTQPPPRPARAPPPPAATGPSPALALRIAAPAGNVWVRGRGIDAELGGAIEIGGTLARPEPRGALTLRRGTLEVLARRLTFTRGTVGFGAGTFVPELDLLATAPTRTANVSIAVTGPANKPEVRFTSTPELPQDEVLARLLFDRATGNLSPFELAQIAAAVAQLTGVGGGGAGALDRVRSALGLDRLGVGGTAGGTGAAVEAGRYVAPGVFVGVRQGTEGRTGVGVEVQVLPRLKLEGQTATGPAGDRLGLSYEFEY